MVEQGDYAHSLFKYCLVKNQSFVSTQTTKEGYFDDPVGVGARAWCCVTDRERDRDL